MKLIIVGLLAMMLAGCSGSMSSLVTDAKGRPITQAMVISKCPALKQYTPEQMARAATELRSLADDSELAKLITDYGKMREACRVISNKLKTGK